MATRRARASAPIFTEKEFYLDEFRGRTLLFAVHHDGAPEPLRAVGEVARDLLANDTRVLILLGGPAARGRAALRAISRGLASPRSDAAALPRPQAAGDPPVLTWRDADRASTSAIPETLLLNVWRILRAGPLLVLCCEDCVPERLADFAQQLGARLRVHKLVIVDRAGGVQPPGSSGPLSFMDEGVTEALLRQGEAEFAGLAARRPLLHAIRRGLVAGITSVNLCPLDGLARELFTYEGSGTLFTREDYCRVARLGVDDFHEVEKLLERGQREGYLKSRTPDDIGRILISGYGATIGEHHLAGVCALQTEAYAAENAGEIVGLYTITRFKGEGVGAKLVECMKSEGARLGLAYLFACTIQDRVGQFFVRQGFRSIPPEEAPAAKWLCYDADRRAELTVYRYDY
jgi:N-acetylglutamate synthase-like GNAT family acetyltransferase